MNESFESIDKELLVYDHYDRCKEHLHDTHRDMIAFEESRERPAPHHMTHREVHQDQQETDRCKKTSPEDRSLPVFESSFVSSKTALLCALHGIGRLEPGAVTRVGYGPDDLLRRGASLNSH